MNGKTIGFILAALLMLSACRRIQRLDRPYADNPEMQEKVRKSFNLAIALPADMQSSKQGKDFFWLSNNAASGMKNVVIYRIRSCDTLPLSVERFCELRDSVMKISKERKTACTSPRSRPPSKGASTRKAGDVAMKDYGK